MDLLNWPSLYHLLLALLWEAMVVAVFIGWRYTQNPDYRRDVWAFAGVLALRLIVWVGQPVAPTRLGPLFGGLEAAALVGLGWAAVAPFVDRRVGTSYPLVGLALVGLCTLAFLPGWWSVLAGGSEVSYGAFWQQPAWYAINVLLLATPVLILWTNEHSRAHGPVLAGLGILGLASVVSFTGSLLLVTRMVETGLAAGLSVAGLIGSLLGYGFLAFAVYRNTLYDISAHRDELRTVSQEALRRTQETLFLVETSRAIGESLDFYTTLNCAAENITMALDADRCAVLLLDPDGETTIELVAQYTPLGRAHQSSERTACPLPDQPLLDYVVKRREQLLLDGQTDSAPLRALYDLLGAQRVSPTILQSLVHHSRRLGVLVVCNDHSQRPFRVSDGQLCQGISAQLAAAIENARLYQALETRARQLAELLRLQEDGIRRQTAILESVAEGVIVSNQDGRITTINAAAERILTVQRDRIRGRSLTAIIRHPTDDVDDAEEELAGLGTPLRTVLELENKAVLMNAAPVVTPSGDFLGTVAVLRDITKEQEAERAKSEFITSISHELRTPITAIRGYAEALNSGMVGGVTPTQSHFLRIIRDNAIRMVGLTENLIAVSEIERGALQLEYQGMDLHLIAGEVVSAFRTQIENRQLNVGLDLASDLPLIEADPLRVRQLLDNLVSNAIKFTYPGGHITIGARVLRSEENTADDLCTIWVADTGIGITLEEQTRIWERFYRPRNPLAQEASGLGMGLSLVKSLAESHGGRVWMESTPGVGSTFTVLLPLRRPRETGGTALQGPRW